ncbi:MAG: hypothetical protein U1F37_09205 [Alphaproteobacteria bacterium]
MTALVIAPLGSRFGSPSVANSIHVLQGLPDCGEVLDPVGLRRDFDVLRVHYAGRAKHDRRRHKKPECRLHLSLHMARRAELAVQMEPYSREFHLEQRNPHDGAIAPEPRRWIEKPHAPAALPYRSRSSKTGPPVSPESSVGSQISSPGRLSPDGDGNKA